MLGTRASEPRTETTAREVRPQGRDRTSTLLRRTSRRFTSYSVSFIWEAVEVDTYHRGNMPGGTPPLYVKCRALNRRRQSCGRWALRGASVCISHGAATSATPQHRHHRDRCRSWHSGLPGAVDVHALPATGRSIRRSSVRTDKRRGRTAPGAPRSRRVATRIPRRGPRLRRPRSVGFRFRVAEHRQPRACQG